jgi:UDP-N-acetylglucosamine--N-acetylmuramyl-(pentapeptide) pyrophosphoryl-undecaprenol N-acetylglucosamine transferase
MARVTALGFADAAPSVAGRTVVTGFPLRDIAPGTIDGWRRGDERLTLLVMGGSQGAHALNMICGEAVSGMDVPRLRLVHLTGKADEAAMSELYRRSGIDARVFAFLSDMGKAYGSADFAVCRAGAASCAELEFMRVPALLVPLPGAPRDHQTRNASSACSDGGMMMRRQADLTVEWLRGFISGMCRDRSVLIEMKRRLEARPARDSTGVLAELVESVGSRRSKGGSQDAHL